MIKLAKLGVNKMIGYEIGASFEDDVSFYNKFLSMPTTPPGDSGVTVGVGFDCGYNTKETINKVWSGKINNNLLAFLISAAGVKGAVARRLLKPEHKRLNIDFAIAKDVFYNHSLPIFTKMAIKAYPNLPKINPLAAAIIVGLVYNRGSSLVDSSPKAIKEQSRKEMRELKIAIDNIDYKAMANCFIKMCRLWDGVPDFVGDNEVKINGLIARRKDEANIIATCEKYIFSEMDLILLPI